MISKLHTGYMITDKDLAIGIDMGGTSIKIAVIGGTEILEKAEPVATMDYGTPEAVFTEVGKRIKELQVKYPTIRAVGMGLPGFVDHDAGTADSLANVPGWYGVPVRRLLEELSGLPAAVDNDANCMAYAEWQLGAGQGMNDLVCLTLGTGVGSGIIVNGKMLHGFMSAAGELGQMSIDYRGRAGYYKNYGALEDYIGHRNLTADAMAAYAAVGLERTEEECSPLGLEKAAEAGCPVALACWDDLARKLACCLVSCHYILNPQAFIIGGGVAKAGDWLFKPLRQYVKEQVYAPHFERLQILPAMLSNDAGMIGAAAMALREAAR